jgi:hypothetical protein
MVSWAMIRNKMNGRELTALIINLRRLPDVPGLWVSPVNSGGHRATPYLGGRADTVTTIRRLGEHRAQWKKAEFLVTGGVPIDAVSSVVFCDEHALQTWWPVFTDSLPDHAPVAEPQVFPVGRWQLPRDYAAQERDAPSGTGRNQLAHEAERAWPEPTRDDSGPDEEPHWMDLDDWDAPEEAEGAPSWSDFYDDGEPDDLDWYELSIRD